jgi:hypothetical protein
MTTTVEETEHIHNRPDWHCRVCKDPWPCDKARADLKAEFHRFRSVLAIYMWCQMYDAMTDLTSHGEPTPPDLYRRFVSWARDN